MNQICQTASGESKFVSMSESYQKNADSVCTNYEDTVYNVSLFDIADNVCGI